RAMDGALRAHMPDGITWSEPTGGFFSWMTVPVDTLQLRPAALEAGVMYVPGSLFGGPPNTLRLSFSLLDEDELETAVVRLSTLF
ncbi:MAG TPA: aminotransferase class I/II-fold pyridoxal phosphate-dependent enzyme, partial [Solirubrobacteraceae bacterium]|nr:aminotransferase class I/II-fold pyridoxal phosphate-dependent enzyme [Solirubrobacteraceae bacterium]